MDAYSVKEAVKDKANYGEIVAWLKGLGDMDVNQLVLLVDVLGEMSEEIFEYYKALCDLCREQLQRIRGICEEKGWKEAFPDDSMRDQLSYVIKKSCDRGFVLREKYENLVKE